MNSVKSLIPLLSPYRIWQQKNIKFKIVGIISGRWKVKLMFPNIRVTETSGIYNTETKLLEEAETLDHYSFDIKEKLVFDGGNKI